MMGKIIQPCSKPLTNQTRYWWLMVIYSD
jgi:hypothetical protein